MFASEKCGVLVKDRLSIFPGGIIRRNGELDISRVVVSLILSGSRMNRIEI